MDFDVASQFVRQLYALNNSADVNKIRYKKLMNMTGKFDQIKVNMVLTRRSFCHNDIRRYVF